MPAQNILVVAAHPDDEVLGCGGTMARLAGEGKKVFTLILGEGITSRDRQRKTALRKGELRNIKKEAVKANKLLGVKEIFTYDFPDNRFDTVALLNIIKTIEDVKKEIKPDVIYTHYHGDLNIDHRITFEAVLTASRPVKGETVKEIYSFCVPSSTEWGYPDVFRPDTFIDVQDYMEKKLKALRCYTSEKRNAPHPRSEVSVKRAAAHWGGVSGIAAAEVFETIRVIK